MPSANYKTGTRRSEIFWTRQSLIQIASDTVLLSPETGFRKRTITCGTGTQEKGFPWQVPRDLMAGGEGGQSGHVGTWGEEGCVRERR